LHKENLNQHWTLLLLPFTNDHYVEALTQVVDTNRWGDLVSRITLSHLDTTFR